MCTGVIKSFIDQNITYLILLLICLFSIIVTQAQNPNQHSYQTQKIIDAAPPGIDGIFNEEVWQTVDWANEFTQREPYDGEKPTQSTQFKILYDDNNLYIAIKVGDEEPAKIDKRLSRRDNFDGDWVAVALDSYFDKLTAFAFGVNAAGVKLDFRISNDDEMDDTWDPVWYVKTSIDNEGWNAEMKIPLTQLRFSDNEEHTWGLQVMRWLFRKEEFSAWQHFLLQKRADRKVIIYFILVALELKKEYWSLMRALRCVAFLAKKWLCGHLVVVRAFCFL